MKLPKTVLVKVVKDGDLSFLSADTDAIGMVEMGDTIKVGVYKLVETKTIRGVTEISNVKRVKK